MGSDAIVEAHSSSFIQTSPYAFTPYRSAACDRESPGPSATRAASNLSQSATSGSAGIVTNSNTVPYDPRKPFSPSGIRLGTPAVTSRGMGEAEMRLIGKWIDDAIAHANEDAALARIAGEVTEMCRKFPAPGIA